MRQGQNRIWVQSQQKRKLTKSICKHLFYPTVIMRYWIPYKWSKSRIVPLIMKLLPKWLPIRDVFGWWWAISLACLDSWFYNEVNYNELDPDIYNLFKALCNGELNIKELKKRFVTREDFLEIKGKEHKTPIDNAILLCYSFWNNMSNYMYWKDIELRKQLLHKIHFKDIKDKQELDDTLWLMTDSRILKLKDWTEYRIYMYRDYNDYINDDYPRTTFKYKIKERKLLDWSILQYYDKDMDHQKHYQLERLQSLERLERLQSLQSLERLERLERLESLQRLELHNKDYRELDIPAWDVIYCDPPYENSSQYKIWDFDSVAFRERAEEKSKTNPIFISSYIGRDWRKEIDTGKWNMMNKKDWKHTDHKEKIFYKYL